MWDVTSGYIRRRELLAALGTVGAAGGVATGTARGGHGGDWPFFQHDPANAGLVESTSGPTSGFVGERIFDSEDVVGSPVIADGRLFVATSDGVVALDRATEREDWRAGPDPGRTHAPIFVRDGLLYVAGTGDAHLRALDTATGETVWMKEIGRGAPGYEPTNDVVFLARYGLDARTGEQRWRTDIYADQYRAPAAAEGRLYLLDEDANLAAVEGSDGSVAWQRENNHTAAPTFVSTAEGAFTSMVLAPLDYSKVIAYRADDGTELWTSPDLMTRDLTTSVAVTPSGGALAVVTYGNAIAVYLQDGSVAWRTNTDGFLNTPPVVVDDVAYAATNEERFVAIDVTDGTVLEGSAVGRPKPYAAPIVHDGTAYLASRNGVLRIDEGGVGQVDLQLELTDDSAEQGGTAVITFRVTNGGDAEATGLKGLIDPPSDAWDLVDSGELTSVEPGGVATADAELAVPEDAEGEYDVGGIVQDDAGNEARDTGTVTVAPTASVRIESVRLVQRTAETVVEEPDGSIAYRPDPPTPVVGLPTVAEIGFTQQAFDRFADDDRVRLVVEVDGGPRGGSVTLTGSQLVDLGKLVAGNPDQSFEMLLEVVDSIPTFPLRPDVESVTVRFEGVDTSVTFEDAEHTVDVDEALVGGTAADAVEMPPLRVGFVEIRDVEGGDNYGHPRDGGVRAFGKALESAILGLKRQYPTPEVEWYAHPDPVAGGDSIEADLKGAYDVLADAENTGTIDAFDATVAIVPRDYFPHHGSDSTGLHKTGGPGDTQPQAAAAVAAFDPANGRGCGAVAATTAHEVGHHMLPFKAYPKPMSARCEPGVTGDVLCQLFASGLNRVHARTFRGYDKTAVRVLGYDVGGYEVPAIATDRPCSDVGGDRDRPSERQGDALLAPGGGGWIDAFHHNDMVSRNAGTARFDPARPVVGDGDETTVASVIVDLEGESPSIAEMAIRNGVPTPDGEGDVSVTVEGPNGETLSTVSTARRVVLAAHGGEIEIRERTQATVPFEPEATGIAVRDAGADGGERTARVNTLGHGLEAAVRSVPDRGLTGDPEESRDRLLSLARELADHVDADAYEAARETIATFETAVRERLTDYDAAGNQYTRATLLTLANRMLDRVDRVATVAETPSPTEDDGTGLGVPAALSGLAALGSLLKRRRDGEESD